MAVTRHDGQHEMAAGVPLLQTHNDDIPDDDLGDEIGADVTLDLSNTDGWFIWGLTFSAGISGLLFGYE